jgi:hypothetical protein
VVTLFRRKKLKFWLKLFPNLNSLIFSLNCMSLFHIVVPFNISHFHSFIFLFLLITSRTIK